jgi:hypothetical protein
LGISSAAAAPPAQDAFGTIKGRLIWGGDQAPPPRKVEVDKDAEVCGKMPIFDPDVVVDAKSKGVENGFAYLVKPKGTNPDMDKALLQKQPELVIDQRGCIFVPYATAMHKDQKLIFKSSDPVAHNVHYVSFTNAPYNRMLPPNGQDEVRLVAETRTIPLTCDFHKWMRGYIMVFDHPFFALTKPDGSFEIQGVPAGIQRLVVRHGKGGFVSPNLAQGIEVKVEPGKTVDVGEFKLDPAKVK